MRTYKEEQEAFVSNSKGSSADCVLICIAHAPALLLLLKLIQNHRRPRLFRDFVFFVLPLLCSITIFADAGYLSLALLLISEIYVLRSNYTRHQELNGSRLYIKDSEYGSEEVIEKSFITYFKGIIMLVTCLSILAVDFRIFPRRFAKTETFGISLMDVGIGGFIVSSAITSKYAKETSGMRMSKPIVTSLFYGKRIPWRNIVVLLLGIGRMIVIKFLNYHEKSSEYGVHWNFFVTLFGIWTIADIFHVLIPRRMMIAVSVLILSIYQFILSNSYLPNYIFAASRTNFFSANREGIFSLVSFVPLYLIAESFSSRYFFPDNNNSILLIPTITSSSSLSSTTAITALGSIPSSATESHLNTDSKNDLSVDLEKNETISSSSSSSLHVVEKEESESKMDMKQYTYLWMPVSFHVYRICRALTYSTVFTWLCWIVLSRIQPTSRRLSNFTYILIILAMSSSLLLMIQIADVAGDIQVKIVTLEYLNKYQLWIFLMSNILTGIVNMSVKTIYLNRYYSITILTLYSFIIVTTAWGFHKMQERKAYV